MKSTAIAILAAMAMMDGFSKPSSGNGDCIAEALNKPKPKITPPNHKEFTIQGITVTALSKKRAIKKVQKILKQQQNENRS